MKFEINKLISIRFQSNNEFRYYQDRRFHNNVPDNIDFYPIEIDDRSVVCIGNGYGIMKHHNLPGSYGNGSISVDLKEFNDIEIEKLQIIIDQNNIPSRAKL